MSKILVIAFVAALLFAAPAQALLISNTDAWQYTNLASASSGTIHPNSSVWNMFGANLGSVETSNTVFNDYSAQDYWHTVEWTMNAPMTLGSFNLVAAHDDTGSANGYRDQNYRGFGAFTLEYLDASDNWQTVYSLSNIGTTAVLGDGQIHPVYGGGADYPNLWYYELYADVAPVTAQTWRASFQQYGPANYDSSGPRILELDGYAYQGDSVVPEPATMILLGTGLAGAFLRRRAG